MGRVCSTLEERRNAYRKSQKERDHLEDLVVGGRITLKWILAK
jgi:hypothetical protein